MLHGRTKCAVTDVITVINRIAFFSHLHTNRFRIVEDSNILLETGKGKMTEIA